MLTTTIKIIDNVNLSEKTKKIIARARKGVREATESGVEWIKADVFEGQRYVGSSNYPDVTPATKKSKARRGKEKVGIDTANLKNSFDSSYKEGGLIGIISGGGKGYADFLKRWKIDRLFMEKRGRKTKEIIENEVKRNL